MATSDNPSNLQAFEWELETDSDAGFNANTAISATARLPLITPIDWTSLTQEKVPTNHVAQYRGEGFPHANGLKRGRPVIDFWMTGHGSTTNVDTSLTNTETLLGTLLGNAATAGDAATTLTGGTVTVPTTTASGTFSAGGMTRLGALGDGDGEGQFYAISTHSALNLTLLNDMAGAPANGAVMYAPTLIYPHSAPTSTRIRGVRGRGISSNLAYTMYGIHAESITLTGFNTGQHLQASVQLDTGNWDSVGSVTFPSTATGDTVNPEPNCGGSFHIQDVGTTTRNTLPVVDLSITINLNHRARTGYGSAWQYNDKIGAYRAHDPAAPPAIIEFAIAATDQTATPDFDAAWLANSTRKIIVITLNTADGSALGLLFRSCCWYGPRPTQSDLEGRNVRRYRLAAHTGATLTNDLTRAPWVIARG